MRYFGEKSISVYVHRLLPVAWGIVLLAVLFGTFILTIAAFSIDLGDPLTKTIVQSCTNTAALSDHEWAQFLRQPVAVKLLVLPYIATITTLLLLVLSKSRHLFGNFRRDAVFHPENIAILRSISRLLIGFGILTMNFTTILVSLILLLVCEILRNGTVLKDELDLTI